MVMLMVQLAARLEDLQLSDERLGVATFTVNALHQLV